MDESWLLAVLALFPMAGMVLLLRRQSKSWFSPGPLFAVWWFAVIAFALFGAPDYPVWGPAAWIILLLAALFSFPAAAFERVGRTVPARPPPVLSLAVLRAACVVGVLAGLASVQVLLSVYRKTLLELVEISTWIEVGAQFSEARYVDDVSQPLAATLLSIGFYFGSLVGGVLWVRSRKRVDRLLSVAPLLVALMFASVTTTRAVVLFALGMFLGTAFATSVLDGAPLKRLFRPRIIIGAIAGPALLFVMFVALQFSRGGKTDLSALPDMVNHIRVWFFGYLAAFSGWMHEWFTTDEPLRLGQRTFGGIFQALGIEDRTRGSYGDYFALPGGKATNIYTALRGLIEDFGPLIVPLMAAVGAMSGWAYGAVARRKLAALPLLALVYAFMLWTPIVSLLTYNTIVLSFVLFWGVVLAARRPAYSAPYPVSTHALPL